MATTAPLGLTADTDLEALAVCPDCDGLGVVFDHTSIDPQQHWDRSCVRCCETGVIDTSEERAV